MSDLFIGTSAYPKADESLLKGAGIGWVRQGFPIPVAYGTVVILSGLGNWAARNFARTIRQFAAFWQIS